MKKLLFSFVYFFSVSAIASIDYQNKLSAQTFARYMAEKPADCLVVTDLHDVALTRIGGDYDRFTQLSFKQKIKFFTRIGGFGITHCFYLAGLSDRPSIEEWVLSSKASKKVKNQVLELISPFSFSKEMGQFYRDCKKNRVPVVVFSNIGDCSYAYLQAKNPEHFACFSSFHIAGRENYYMMKPQEPSYVSLFQHIRAQNAGRLPRIIFYLDDKKVNTDMFATMLKTQPDGKDVLYLPYCFTGAEQFVVDLGRQVLPVQ